MAAMRGYISVLLLPALAALLLLILAVVSQQQTLQQRWHLQSSADAMAHSAATIMAREFNILAVLNRALIANQVAQAQLVGLNSWYSNIASATERLALVTSWIPYVNGVTRQLAATTTRIELPMQSFIAAGLVLQQGLIGALQIAQVMVRYSFATLLPQTLSELAHIQNLEQQQWTLFHSPGLIKFPWLWWTFVPVVSAAHDDELLADMVRKSRDPFTQNRSYNWFNIGFVKARKTGGSDLHLSKQGQWSWQSMDTVALHVRMLFSRIEIPWGDGVSYQGSRLSHVQPEQFGQSRRINPLATGWALTSQTSVGTMFTPTYFNRKALEPEQWPAVIIIFDDVIAKAGIRFSRPQAIVPRRDQRHEQANLFNALWEPELQSLSKSEKVLISQWHQSQPS